MSAMSVLFQYVCNVSYVLFVRHGRNVRFDRAAPTLLASNQGREASEGVVGASAGAGSMLAFRRPGSPLSGSLTPLGYYVNINRT